MIGYRTICAAVAAACLAGCSHSSSPTGPGDGSNNTVLQGQAINALDSSALPGLTVQVGRTQPATTDANGYFQSDVGGAGTYATTIKGTAVVEHDTPLTGPTSDRVRVSLIPASFDLQAFDEMFRTTNSRLQRWTTRPSLVVIATAMAFTSGGTASEYDAINDRLTDDEVIQLEAHLTEGLSLLTGGTYTSFAAVDVERPSPGDHVNVARTGKIVVGRFTGVVGLRETIGFGTWHEESDGSVDGGSIFLDRDFDRTSTQRRLLRIHELGHALGYLHVTSRTSIMNPAIGPEPTDFDRDGAIIAFKRPPGNVSPDVDPGGAAARPFSFGSGRWAAPVP